MCRDSPSFQDQIKTDVGAVVQIEVVLGPQVLASFSTWNDPSHYKPINKYPAQELYLGK